MKPYSYIENNDLMAREKVIFIKKGIFERSDVTFISRNSISRTYFYDIVLRKIFFGLAIDLGPSFFKTRIFFRYGKI